MAVPGSQPQEVDLDQTDKLPILEGVAFDVDVADDAERFDPTATAPSISPVVAAAASNIIRPSSTDPSSLAESMRAMDERIERQSADYQALNRAYELTRDAEAAAHARAEAALRETERQVAEARTLRDSLNARDATIAQVLHSLGEREAQLSGLQAEHAKVLPPLEARAKHAEQLEEELLLVRERLDAASADLKSSQDQLRTLSAQLKHNESETMVVRADLALSQSQTLAYLELLRTRDWRRGFDLNLFRDLDARMGAADADVEALNKERDLARGRVAELEAVVAAQQASIAKLQAVATAQTSAADQQAQDLAQAEQHRANWLATLGAAEAENTRLSAELTTRDQALAAAQGALNGYVQRLAQLESEHAAKMAELQADAQTREEEIAVLMAHLQEARRPVESIEEDARRVREELAAKTAALAELADETEKLRTSLERTRGVLEEREFLIRRLERSESNHGNALGRIPAGMDRSGSVTAPVTGPAAALEWSPELIRIDGDRSIAHRLGRRTRIGRASGCELHIDSSSVSRHHALILAGTREAIIEDLNSTNGVIINGRKVTRQVLSDGDIVTIGEIQFRFVAKPMGPPPRA